jgi:DNA polymerase-4
VSIIVDNNTKLVISGLTGREGSFHGLRNREYGTDVVAGVTPKKGGQDVEGIPIFDAIADAVSERGANTSMIFVPARFAAAAIEEVVANLGSTSYGKGTVQTVVRLANEGELILTWSRLNAPSGYTWNELGVLPNICTSKIADVGQLNASSVDSSQGTLMRWHALRNPTHQEVSDLRKICPPGDASPERDVEIATRLRRDVRERVGLPITVGVARTKFLAKVASGVAKPDGLLVVPPDGELAFLHPLPVERLWGVGPVTAGKLRDRGITSVGEVAGLGEAALVSMVGQASGRHLHALAHNRDPRPVDTGRRRRSIGSQRALGRAPRSPEDLDAVLIGLVERVTRRMRGAGRAGRTVVLRLRFDDFTRATRSHTLPWPTSHSATILVTARALLATAMPMIRRQGITLVGVAVANLDDSGVIQLTLPFERHNGDLDAALDQVRERFGTDAVTRAVLLGRDQGLSVPILPD